VHSRIDDTLAYLLGCPHEHFLAFIEYIFKLDFYWRICPDENQLVEQINHLFLIDQLPYALTPFVREKEIEVFYGTETEVYKIVSHPKVINRENEFAYSSLIQPTIKLLLDEGFSYANKEFIDALEDYRKGDYGDCLTKCASSFESTMKIICTRNHWHYNETDTASRLLHIVMEKSDLDSYFEQPLIITATIRNKLSTSHGSGTQLRKVPPSKVRFAINATAAAILLIVEHCYESSN
jgi:hypothetical protein